MNTEKDQIKKVDKKGKYYEIVAQDIKVIQPAVLPALWIRKVVGVVGCVEFRELYIRHKPYMHNMSGTMIINILDRRHTNLHKKLVYHMAFEICKDQDIIIDPYLVMGPAETEEPFHIQIKDKETEAKSGANIGRISIQPRWRINMRSSTGGEPSIRTYPTIAAVQGKNIPAENIGKILRGYETACDLISRSKKHKF
nr:putative P4 protein [Cytorhabdovirus sp.]